MPTVSLAVETLPAPAPVHVPREHWGLSLCRRHRGEREVVCSGRDRGTRHAAICGKIRCMGSVGSFRSFLNLRDSPLDHDLPKVLGDMTNAASAVSAGVALPTRGWR